jgi:hypothetical protein
MFNDWEFWAITAVVVAIVLYFVVDAFLHRRRLKRLEDFVDAREGAVPPPPKAESYDDTVRNWNRLQEKRLRDIQLAQQDAQHLATEGDKKVLFTIRDYFECPDDEPIFKIEVLANDDPRCSAMRTMHSGVVVDDQRCLPHEINGYNFMPRPRREAWVETCKRRKAAILAGSLTRKPPVHNGTAVPGTLESFKSTDPKLHHDIEGMKSYASDLKSRADKAFAEELEKIKIDARVKARKMLEKTERHELVVTEARARDVAVAVIEEEFIDLVVKEAVTQAQRTYDHPNPDLLAALTPDRIKNGTMFTH